MTAAYSATYDAWNRLVEVKDGSNVVLKCEYDGLGRRTKKFVNTSDPLDQTYDEYRHFFYNSGWRILETRLSESEGTGPETLHPEYQYVWSRRYIDSPVLRDENKDDDGDCIDGSDERLYYLTDANMNVTALVEDDGDIAERYVYDPYGRVTVYSDDWSTTVDWDDSKKNPVRYCGYYFDNETGLYCVRYRFYVPPLGRWLQRDPAGYVDGMSLYEYSGSRPTVSGDPTGLKWWDFTISSRAIACRGDITIDSKKIWKWNDIIRDMTHWLPPHLAPGKRFDQSCDFTVAVRTDWEIAIKVVGYAPVTGGYEDGTVANISFSTFGFSMPTASLIGPTRKNPRKTVAGNLCRKVVYLRQECCIERTRLLSGRASKWEDRYQGVYLYGMTVAPQNTLPAVLECDVSLAEQDLQGYIQRLNSANHCMCTEGLDGLPLLLEVNGGLRSSTPGTVPYVKGAHDPLILHSKEEYDVDWVP